MTTNTSTELKPAKLPRLLASITYDLIIIIALLLFATTLLFFICLLLQLNQPEPSGIYFRAYIITIITGYYHLSWLNNSQTIGMKAWNLVLLNNNKQERITLRQSLLRIIGGVTGIIFFGFGYFYLYFNKQHKTLADILSNTKIYHVTH